MIKLLALAAIALLIALPGCKKDDTPDLPAEVVYYSNAGGIATIYDNTTKDAKTVKFLMQGTTLDYKDVVPPGGRISIRVTAKAHGGYVSVHLGGKLLFYKEVKTGKSIDFSRNF